MSRRTQVLVGGAIAMLLVLSTVSLYVSRPAEEVTVDAAVRAFRQSAAGAPAPEPEAAAGVDAATPASEAPAAAADPAKPAPGRVKGTQAGVPAPAPAPRHEMRRPGAGVYTYDTTGYERTDALQGAHREYPKETAWTVRHTSCGVIERWEPLRERWSESEGCVDPTGFALSRFAMYHEFFQQSDTRTFKCKAGYVFKYAAKVGDTWNFECDTPETHMVMKVIVLGREPVNVGGRSIDATHMRYEATMTGGIRGTNIQERWVDDANKLPPLRLTNVTRTRADSPFGDVAYDEEFTLHLRTTEPQR